MNKIKFTLKIFNKKFKGGTVIKIYNKIKTKIKFQLQKIKVKLVQLRQQLIVIYLLLFNFRIKCHYCNKFIQLRHKT